MKETTRTNKTEGLHTEAKIIPCQNCTNLHKDFKLPTDLKSVHQVKTITVIEGSDTKLITNELDVPEQTKSIDRDDTIADIDEDIADIDLNSSFEENEDHEILKRSVRRMNFTRKHESEPIIRWREFEKVKHPIKREIPSNRSSVRVRKRKLKTKPLENELKKDHIVGEDERKATELLEAIERQSKSKESEINNSLLNQTGNVSESYKTGDQNGTEAQHKLMTQAIIKKPNGLKVVLQDKAYSEPIRKNIRFDDFDRTDRAFKTNINFYDDLPDYSKPHSHSSSYDSDSPYFKRPKGNSYKPDKMYKFSHDDYDSYPKHKSYNEYHDTHPKYKSPSLDNFDEHYDKYTPNSEEDYNYHHKYKTPADTYDDTYTKYKSPADTYDDTYTKYKSPKPMNDMIDVMPDHDAQYEYVPMEKDENGNGKIKQHRPSSHREKYNRGGYDSDYRRPTSSSYDSGEDDTGGGGYGYSSLPQKTYYSHDKHKEYHSRPTNNHHSYKEDNRQPYKSKYRDDTYPKYEKVHQEDDYDAQGYGSEEKPTYHGRKSNKSHKNREKPLTFKVNIDDEDDEGSDENQDFDYASRNVNAGRIAARVTKVPKTLEEYHKLHRTWEKRPPKSKKSKSHRDDYDEPKRKSRPVRPKSKQSSRRFPPSPNKIEKPHVSYEFEGPNSHVAMDFVTSRTPTYDEHSEAFRDTSAESDESGESRIRPSPIKTSPDIDSVFNSLNDDSFKRITTEKPYRITQLAGKPLYSREDDSAEFSRDIIRDITPKLNQRDKEDLYNKLKHEIGHKKYKRPQDSSYRDDIFKELGLDFDSEPKKGSYRPNYGPDKSRILIPKVGKYDDFEDSAPRKSWSFHNA